MANENEESGDEKLIVDDNEKEGPTPQRNANESENNAQAKNGNEDAQLEMGVDPISMRYANLDLYWEDGGSMDLSSKEAKKALLKPSEVDKSNEKQAASLPQNASTFEYILKGMKDYRSYLIRARARNKSGWGQYSSPVELLTEKMEVDSKILKAGEKEILTKWLPKKYQSRRLKLIFRASKHGFVSTSFHAKCDNKAPTLSVVKAKGGNVFGGFTTVPWGMTNAYRPDAHAFIFLLRKKDSKHKKKKEKPSKKKKRSRRTTSKMESNQ